MNIQLLTVGLVLLFTPIIVVLLVVRQIDHHYTQQSCTKFSQQSGYDTKFVDYNFWTYDCLAKQTDGRYIPTDQLRGGNNNE